jgi:hypothetical protein
MIEHEVDCPLVLAFEGPLNDGGERVYEEF